MGTNSLTPATSAPAGKWMLYANAWDHIESGVINLKEHEFRIALFTPHSNAYVAFGANELAELTHEVGDGSGYEHGGLLLPLFLRAKGDTTHIHASPATWWVGPDDAPLVAAFAVIYRAGTVNGITDALVWLSVLNTEGGSVSVRPGLALTIKMNRDGIMTVGGQTPFLQADTA